jgi:hypothetical protein
MCASRDVVLHDNMFACIACMPAFTAARYAVWGPGGWTHTHWSLMIPWLNRRSVGLTDST